MDIGLILNSNYAFIIESGIQDLYCEGIQTMYVHIQCSSQAEAVEAAVHLF